MMITLCYMTRRARVARSSFRMWAWWSPTRGWWWRPSWWPASYTSLSTSAAADRDTGTGGEWGQLTMWTLQCNANCLSVSGTVTVTQKMITLTGITAREKHIKVKLVMNTASNIQHNAYSYTQEVPASCHTSSVISTSSSGVKMTRSKRRFFFLMESVQ